MQKAIAEKPTDKNAPAQNGEVKPAQPSQASAGPIDPPATEASSDPKTSQANKQRGVIPTMPECVIYRKDGRVIAAVYNPVDGSVYQESGKGEGSAKGALEDSGFRLSLMYDKGPEWLYAKLPAGIEIIGFASIKGFPLPKQ